MVQVPRAATVPPQVFVSLKPALATILVMAKAEAGLLLVSVTVIGALGMRIGWVAKVKEVGLSVTGWTPVPARLTVCGLVIALSVIVMDPVYAPVVVGVNVTLMVQVPRAATVPPQVFVSLKLALATILVMAKAVD